MNNKLKFIKNVIYKGKRSYGLPIDYYQTTSHTTDTETGEKTTVLGKVRIKKAIVLRAREARSFVYDLAYISANKDFTEGGFFDPEDRRIIVDVKDMPSGFVPTDDDYVIFQGRRYTVKEIYSFENNSAFMFLGRHVRGAKIVRIEEALSVMDLQQGVTYEIWDRLTRSIVSELVLTHEFSETP